MTAPVVWADPLSAPAMGPTLAANPHPLDFDTGLIGKIDVSGVATALAFGQTNPREGDRDGRLDLTNAQVILQKGDGHFQFYTQLGSYNIPALGVEYVSSSYYTQHQFGAAPVAYFKWAPNAEFNVQVGKMPALIGIESDFTFQNYNIQRGLLWNQTPTISQGIQINYTKGKWAVSGSYGDGFYSGTYNWLLGQVVYTINARDSLSLNGGGSLSANGKSTFAVPLAQNNEAVLIFGFNHAQGPFAINPYIQYTHVDRRSEIGIHNAASTVGVAVLGKYSLASNFNIAGRIEYIDSAGGDPADPNAPNLLYGAKSSAWSVTLTPTYQFKVLFVRGEFSYTGISGHGSTLGFGVDGASAGQARAMIETGVIF
jgi:hypothetical protein